eukprot:g5014.t1
MRRFDVDGDGAVDFEDFIDTMGGAKASSSSRPSSRRTTPRGGAGGRGGHLEAAADRKLGKLQSLVQAARDKGVDYAESFAHFDAKQKGYISRTDFGRGLDDLGLDVRGDELDELMDRFDPNGDGKIDYFEFLRAVAPHRADKAYKTKDLVRVVDKLRLMVRKRARQTGSLRDPFDHFADGGSSFGMKQLKTGLVDLNLEVASDDAEDIFEHMDLNRDGKVRYNEFCVFVEDEYHEEVEERVQELISREVDKTGMRRVFEKFDRDGNGRISKSEFSRGLDKLGLDVSEVEVARLMRRFDVDGDGAIDFGDFIEVMDGGGGGRTRGSRRTGGGLSSSSRRESDDLAAVARRLKKMIRDRAKDGDFDIHRPFRHFDRQRKGYIKRDDFEEGLEQLGFSLTDAEMLLLLDRFDADGDGRITYQEFIDFVDDGDDHYGGGGGSSSSSSSSRGADRIVEKLRDLVREARNKGVHYAESFAHFDPKQKGYISRTDFGRGLDDLGLDVRGGELDELMDRFDPNGDGKIDYFEFLRVVAPHGERAYKTKDVVKVVDKLRLMIRKRARQKGGSFRDPFDFFAAGQRKFGLGELESGLRELMDDVRLSRTDLEDIFDHMDLNRDGKVRYNEFVVFVEDEFFGEVEDHVRVEVMRQAERWDGSMDLEKVFDKWDRDGSGRVSKSEFGRGCEKLGLDLSEIELQRLMRRFDVDGDGKIDYGDFIDFVQDGRTRYDRASPSVSKVRAALRRMAEGRDGRTDAWRVFKEIDGSRRGYVNQQEFKRGMVEDLGLDLSGRETKALFEAFDFDGDGYVSFHEFSEFMDGADATSSSSSSSSSSSRRLPGGAGTSRRGSAGMDEQIRSLLDRLRKLVREAKERGVDFRESFEHFDVNYDGEIDRREFQKGLRALNFRATADELDELLDRFGTSGGRLKYRDFLNMVQPREQEEVDDVARRLKKMIRERARDGGDFDIHRPFRHFDRERKGYITRLEFRDGLDELGFSLKDGEVRMLLDRFDADGDGRISYQEFIDFVDQDGTPGVVSSSRDGRLGRGGGAKAGADVEDIVEDLRALLARDRNRDVDFEDIFRRFDADGSGEVDEDELRDALRDVGMRPTSKQIVRLMDAFAGRRNRMRYADLVDLVAPRAYGAGRRGGADRRKREERDRDHDRDDGDRGEVSFVGLPHKQGFKPDQAVVVTATEIRLDDSVRRDRLVRKLYVEYKFLERRKHRSPAVSFNRGSAPIKFAFTKTFPVLPGGSASRKLQAMLDDHGRYSSDTPAEIVFDVYAEDSNGESRRIGTSKPASLHDILDDGEDLLAKRLDIRSTTTSAGGGSLGTLYVDIKGKRVFEKLIPGSGY